MAKFEWIKQILKEVSNETDISYAEVERMWDFTEDQVSRYLRDPSCPKILINGFYKFEADLRLVNKRIFFNLHKCRNAKGEPKEQRNEVIRLLRLRTRLIKEHKSWDKQTELAMNRFKEIEKLKNERRESIRSRSVN